MIVHNVRTRQIEEILKICYAVLRHTKFTHLTNMEDLKIQNNILQMKLNRADVVVDELPNEVSNLNESIVKIAARCNIDLSSIDIQYC